MITPLVAESTWCAHLDLLPTWLPPQTHTLVIAPHPDDETLGAGGLIASLRSGGTRVTVVAVTDGELAYGESPGLAELREQEQARALQKLGVEGADLVRLRLPDTRLAEHEASIVQALTPLLTADTHIIAPWPRDFHPDHEACGRAATAVAQNTGAALSFYLFWTWHRGTPAVLDGTPLVRFPLAAAYIALKDAALREHHSQLEHPSGEPILPTNLLEPLARPYEVFILS